MSKHIVSVKVYVTAQILLERSGTRSREGPREQTYNLGIHMHATIIGKGFAIYGYNSLMKKNRNDKP